MRSLLGWVLVGGWLVGCGAPTEDVMVSTPEVLEEEVQGGRATSGYAAVGMVLTESGLLCTGSLIAPDVVLTAAHCAPEPVVAFYTGKGAAVRRGQSVARATDGMDEHLVIDQVVHPDYVPDSCGVSPDVALLLLAEPSNIRPLPVVRSAALAPGRRCTGVGFGAHGTGKRTTSARKRSATEEVVDVDGTNVVVEGISGIVDHGDSGGPLLCGGRIHGVTSCGPDGPWRERQVVYSRVTPVRTWIDAVMANW